MSMLAAGGCTSAGVKMFCRGSVRVCPKESSFSNDFTVRIARNKLRKIERTSDMKLNRLLMRFTAKLHWWIYHDDCQSASRSKCETRSERVNSLIELFGAALQHAVTVRSIFYKDHSIAASELFEAFLVTHLDKHGQPAGACEWRMMPDFEVVQSTLHTLFKNIQPANLGHCEFDKYISFVIDLKNCETTPSSASSNEHGGYSAASNDATTMNYLTMFNEARTTVALRKAVLELIANHKGMFSSNQLFTIESLPERYFRIVVALDSNAKNEADRTLATISIALLRRAASLSCAVLWLQDTLDATSRVKFEIEQLTDARRADEAFLRAVASVFCWQRAALLDGELAQRAATWTDRPYYADLPALKNRAGIVHNFHSVAFYHILRFLATFNAAQRAIPAAALPIVAKLLLLNYALLDDTRRVWFQDEMLAFAASRCAANAPMLLETVKRLLETNAAIIDSPCMHVCSLQQACRLVIWKTIRFTDYCNDTLHQLLRQVIPPRLVEFVLEPIFIL